MTAAPLVAVVGDVLVDVVVRPQEPVRSASDTTSTIHWRPGGAAANTAAWLASSGCPVRLVGRIGEDLAGEATRRELSDLGVDLWLSVDPRAPTGTVMAVVTDRGAADRDMYTSRGASGRLDLQDLAPGWLDGVTHVHLSGYVLLAENTREAGVGALAQATDFGVGVSVDPSSVGPLRDVGPRSFLGWLPRPLLLTPNAEELQLLSGTEDVQAGIVALARDVGEVAVTLGAAGAAWSDGREVLHQAAIPVSGAIDPVGSGDAFTAGFLAARVRGLSPAERLRGGVLVAGQSVTGVRP